MKGIDLDAVGKVEALFGFIIWISDVKSKHEYVSDSLLVASFPALRHITECITPNIFSWLIIVILSHGVCGPKGAAGALLFPFEEAECWEVGQVREIERKRETQVWQCCFAPPLCSNVYPL